MTGFKLKHVERFRDRFGKVRYYYRKGHGTRTALKGDPGTAEFLQSYAEASRNERPSRGIATPARGTIGFVVESYLASAEFARLRPSTQEMARNIIVRFAAKDGHRLIAQMKREHVSRIIAEKANTPAAANNLLKRIRVLVRYALANGWMETDPTLGIKKFKEGEHHTWTENEISSFEKRWAFGTLARTAFSLALYTGQRRSDLCRMTWQELSANGVRVTQAKTGAKLTIPLHPLLSEALSHWPRAHVSIITGAKGKPYTVESFGNLMADAIDAAGLPARCVLHGIRKAAARRLAEAGCTEKEIAAITGHKTLAEVARYTRAASQEKLASAAILKLRK